MWSYVSTVAIVCGYWQNKMARLHSASVLGFCRSVSLPGSSLHCNWLCKLFCLLRSITVLLGCHLLTLSLILLIPLLQVNLSVSLVWTHSCSMRHRYCTSECAGQNHCLLICTLTYDSFTSALCAGELAIHFLGRGEQKRRRKANFELACVHYWWTMYENAHSTWEWSC